MFSEGRGVLFKHIWHKSTVTSAHVWFVHNFNLKKTNRVTVRSSAFQSWNTTLLLCQCSENVPGSEPDGGYLLLPARGKSTFFHNTKINARKFKNFKVRKIETTTTKRVHQRVPQIIKHVEARNFTWKRLSLPLELPFDDTGTSERNRFGKICIF